MPLFNIWNLRFTISKQFSEVSNTIQLWNRCVEILTLLQWRRCHLTLQRHRHSKCCQHSPPELGIHRWPPLSQHPTPQPWNTTTHISYRKTESLELNWHRIFCHIRSLQIYWRLVNDHNFILYFANVRPNLFLCESVHFKPIIWISWILTYLLFFQHNFTPPN